MMGTKDKANNPSFVLIGQANLHKNVDCATTLANHIYHQMRELDITKMGNLNDGNVGKPRHPRRRDFPATVPVNFD